jgi:hypothetical protein
VAHDRRRIDSQTVDQTDDITNQVQDVVGLDRLGFVGLAKAALIGRDDAETRRRKRGYLMAVRVLGFGPSMAQHHQPPGALLYIMHPDAVGGHEFVLQLGHRAYLPDFRLKPQSTSYDPVACRPSESAKLRRIPVIGNGRLGSICRMGLEATARAASRDTRRAAGPPTTDGVCSDGRAGWIFREPNAHLPPQSENPPPPAAYIPWGSLRSCRLENTLKKRPRILEASGGRPFLTISRRVGLTVVQP